VRNFNVVVFNDFEILDAIGPTEIFAKLDKFFKVEFYSELGGRIKSAENLMIDTLPLSAMPEGGILLIPGGRGTRREVNNLTFIDQLRAKVLAAEYVLAVCTGTAILAKTGLLSNLKATTKKRAYCWVVAQDPNVLWDRRARWVKNGKYYTSAGISASMDMALSFVDELLGPQVAQKVSVGLEYIWNQERDSDPFVLSNSQA